MKCCIVSGLLCEIKVLQLFSRVRATLHWIENKKPVSVWEASKQLRPCPQAMLGLLTEALLTCGELLDSILSRDPSQTGIFTSSQQIGSVCKSSRHSCAAPGKSNLREPAAPACARNNIWVTFVTQVKGTLKESVLGMTLWKSGSHQNQGEMKVPGSDAVDAALQKQPKDPVWVEFLIQGRHHPSPETVSIT